MRRLIAILTAGCTLTLTTSAQVRSIDGWGNNLTNPDYGKAGIPLLRQGTNGYGDGLSAPGGASRPSARAISNALVAQSGSLLNERSGSDFVWQWGQFIDHDLDLTGGASPAEPFDIPVPTGDPFFDPASTGTQVIGLSRSLYEVDGSGVRQQINEITAWLDGSMVYGSDDARALALRSFSGGRLKTGAGGLLPFNVDGLPNAPAPDPSFFVAGDVRSNEQIGLTAMHTLFVREHNHWAARFASLHFTDEQAYQLARAMVGAEIQAITFREFLPTLLGPHAIAPYAGYDDGVDPGIENAFSTACFRVGHTMLSPTLQRLDRHLNEIPAGNISLADSFFNPQEIIDHGIDPILRGLARQRAQFVDTRIVDPVRNFLFGPPGAGGFDLASLNVQRGRDHGLPAYNQMRVDFGLAPRTSFAEVSSDPSLVAALQATYASVDDIDAWIGALAEDHLPQAMVGELVAAVLKDQFERIRDGDRFWYQNAMPVSLQYVVERQTLSRIIRRNTRIGRELQPQAFRVPADHLR